MARYFDSFNRTNGAIGTSDSGDVYSTTSGYVLPVILSNTLTNTDVINPAMAIFDLRLQEFDTTILLDTIVGKTLSYAIRLGTPTDGIIISINGSSDGVLVNGTIGIVKYAGSDILFNSANTLIVNAGTVRIVNTKRNIKVYYGTVLLIDFNISLYSENSGMALSFPSSTYAATVQSITCKALGSVLVSDIGDKMKGWRRLNVTNITVFTDSWILSTLSSVTRMILKEVGVDFMVNTIQVTAASQGLVYLPPGVTLVKDVWITGQVPMQGLTTDEWTHLVALGRTSLPRRFGLVYGGLSNQGPQLMVEPPDATYTLNYTFKPGFNSAYFAVTDDVLFPANWTDVMVDMMVGHSYELDEDPAADRWYTKAAEKLKQIKDIEDDRYNQTVLRHWQNYTREIVVGLNTFYY